jgi:hypothetical protein
MRLLPVCRFVVLVLLVFLGAVIRIPAQTLDPSSADSLAATLKVLTAPAGRGLSIGGDPAAAEIDRQVQELAGSPQLAQEVYALAAQVLADLMKSTGGDTGQLTDTLERARTDPAGFAAGLSPQTLQRLSELAAKISAARH